MNIIEIQEDECTLSMCDNNNGHCEDTVIMEESSIVAILDDGLQDKKIDYDISIACFNSSYGIGNGYLLPAGPLREKLEILKKYSAIFVVGERKNTKL